MKYAKLLMMTSKDVKRCYSLVTFIDDCYCFHIYHPSCQSLEMVNLYSIRYNINRLIYAFLTDRQTENYIYLVQPL